MVVVVAVLKWLALLHGQEVVGSFPVTAAKILFHVELLIGASIERRPRQDVK